MRECAEHDCLSPAAHCPLPWRDTCTSDCPTISTARSDRREKPCTAATSPWRRNGPIWLSAIFASPNATRRSSMAGKRKSHAPQPNRKTRPTSPAIAIPGSGLRAGRPNRSPTPNARSPPSGRSKMLGAGELFDFLRRSAAPARRLVRPARQAYIDAALVRAVLVVREPVELTDAGGRRDLHALGLEVVGDRRRPRAAKRKVVVAGAARVGKARHDQLLGRKIGLPFHELLVERGHGLRRQLASRRA